MKNSLIGIALLGSFFGVIDPTIAVAEQKTDSGISVQDMYYACQEAIKLQDGRRDVGQIYASICASGIESTRATARIADSIYSSNGLTDGLAYKYIFGCPKQDYRINNDILIRVFVKAVKADPKLMSINFLSGLHIIMNREFPCKESRTQQ